MRTTEIDPASLLAAARGIAEHQPVFMLNLLRYRERADYGDRTDLAPCSGRTAYLERYVPAFRTLAPDGTRVVWLGAAVAGVVAPSDELWHDVGIVEYPSFTAFRDLVTGPRYASAAAPHRRAALEDWRLIAMHARTPG